MSLLWVAAAVCPVCAQPHAPIRRDVMYHQSPRSNRYGINQDGLRLDLDEGAGSTEPGVYLSPKPSVRPGHEDIWRVDTRGLELHPDTGDQMAEFQDQGGSYFHHGNISPSRLTLHHRAGG